MSMSVPASIKLGVAILLCISMGTAVSFKTGGKTKDAVGMLEVRCRHFFFRFRFKKEGAE